MNRALCRAVLTTRQKNTVVPSTIPRQAAEYPKGVMKLTPSGKHVGVAMLLTCMGFAIMVATAHADTSDFTADVQSGVHDLAQDENAQSAADQLSNGESRTSWDEFGMSALLDGSISPSAVDEAVTQDIAEGVAAEQQYQETELHYFESTKSSPEEILAAEQSVGVDVPVGEFVDPNPSLSANPDVSPTASGEEEPEAQNPDQQPGGEGSENPAENSDQAPPEENPPADSNPSDSSDSSSNANPASVSAAIDGASKHLQDALHAIINFVGVLWNRIALALGFQSKPPEEEQGASEHIFSVSQEKISKHKVKGSASITHAVLARDIAEDGSASAASASFPNTGTLYAVLSLENARKETQIGFIRSYKGVYLDSAIAHPSRTGLKYLHFQWSLKGGAKRPTGPYSIAFYVDGKKSKTIDFTIN